MSQSKAEQLQSLQTSLNTLLAQRAQLDEQIRDTRNVMAGVKLGIEFQQEQELNAKREDAPAEGELVE